MSGFRRSSDTPTATINPTSVRGVIAPSDSMSGTVGKQIEAVYYIGINTETADTTTDKQKRTIKVDVKKVPNSLTILDRQTGSERLIEFNGTTAENLTVSHYTIGKNKRNEYILLRDGIQMGETILASAEELDTVTLIFRNRIPILRFTFRNSTREPLECPLTELNWAQMQDDIAQLQQDVIDLNTWLTKVEADLTAETEARTRADEGLEASIAAEAMARATADNQLHNAIEGEETNRTLADEALLENIEAEKDRAIAADFRLQEAIVEESGIRQETDAALRADIDAFDAALATETRERVAADSQLTEDLATETARAIAADAELRRDIDAEAVARAAKDSELGDTILVETAARQAADAALTTKINTLIPTAGGVGSYIQKVKQDNEGNVEITAQAFDTTFDNPTNNNAPTTKLVKDFVNSSIATNTAYFRGTYDLVSDLGLTRADKDNYGLVGEALFTTIGDIATNNDYCFVTIPSELDTTERIDRYKFVADEDSDSGEDSDEGHWEYEFTLNNSSFTAAQWAAINSGVTSDKVSNYDAHLLDKNNPHEVTKAQVGLGNVDNTSDLNKPISTATQTALDLKANDNNVVHKTGEETVNGRKTFNSGITVTGGDTYISGGSNTGTYVYNWAYFESGLESELGFSTNLNSSQYSNNTILEVYDYDSQSTWVLSADYQNADNSQNYNILLPAKSGILATIDDIPHASMAIIDYTEELPEITTENKDSLARLDGEDLFYAEYKTSPDVDTKFAVTFASTKRETTPGSPEDVTAVLPYDDLGFNCIGYSRNYFNYYAIPRVDEFGQEYTEEYRCIRIGTGTSVGDLDFTIAPNPALSENDRVFAILANYFQYSNGNYYKDNSAVVVRIYESSESGEVEDVYAELPFNPDGYQEDTLVDITDIYNYVAANDGLSIVITFGSSESGKKRFHFRGILLRSVGQAITKWSQLATVDYVNSQVNPINSRLDSITEQVVSHNTRITTNEENIEDLDARVHWVETEMGTVQIFDVDELPIAEEKYNQKIFRYDHKLYQCIYNADEGAYVKKYSFKDITGTSEITASGNTWTNFTRDVGNDFGTYYTTGDEINNWLSQGGLEVGDNYRMIINNNYNIGINPLSDHDTNTVITITNAKPPYQGATLPYTNIDYLITGSHTEQTLTGYRFYLYSYTGETAEEDAAQAIIILNENLGINYDTAVSLVNDVIAGNEVNYFFSADSITEEEIQSEVSNLESINFDSGYETEYDSKELFSVTVDDLDDVENYTWDDLDRSKDQVTLYFTPTQVDSYDSENWNITKINQEIFWTKVFRSPGDVRLGNSSIEGNFALYRNDEDTDLPITRIEANIRSWNNGSGNIQNSGFNITATNTTANRSKSTGNIFVPASEHTYQFVQLRDIDVNPNLFSLAAVRYKYASLPVKLTLTRTKPEDPEYEPRDFYYNFSREYTSYVENKFVYWADDGSDYVFIFDFIPDHLATNVNDCFYKAKHVDPEDPESDYYFEKVEVYEGIYYNITTISEDVEEYWTDKRLFIKDIAVYYGNCGWEWVEVSGGAKVEIVEELPEVGEENTIYLVEIDEHEPTSSVKFEEVKELPEVGDPSVIYLMDPEGSGGGGGGGSSVDIRVLDELPETAPENTMVLTPLEGPTPTPTPELEELVVQVPTNSIGNTVNIDLSYFDNPTAPRFIEFSNTENYGSTQGLYIITLPTTVKSIVVGKQEFSLDTGYDLKLNKFTFYLEYANIHIVTREDIGQGNNGMAMNILIEGYHAIINAYDWN